MQTSAVEYDELPKSPRRLQFGLATVFAAILMLSVLLGYGRLEGWTAAVFLGVWFGLFFTPRLMRGALCHVWGGLGVQPEEPCETWKRLDELPQFLQANAGCDRWQ
jgi:hypothetical protein